MSYFDQYNSYAGSAALKNGIDPSVFFGLIDVESSWNPNADAPGSSAYGFTQLISGTAAGLGVDRTNPYQNLDGGAKYLGQLQTKYGNTRTALMHYYGSNDPTANAAYADKVLGRASSKYGLKNTAMNLLSGKETPLQAGLAALGIHSKAVDNVTNMAQSALKSIIPGAGLFGGGGGADANGCGTFDFVCKLQAWVDAGGFFKRLALAFLAFIIIGAAFYLMGSGRINEAVKGAVAA